MVPSAPLFLAKSIRCPSCNRPIELWEEGRRAGTFTCPHCLAHVRGLLAYWEIPVREWRRFGRARNWRTMCIAASMAIGGGAGIALGTEVIPGIRILFTLLFLLGTGLLLSSIRHYLRHNGAAGRAYVYRNGAATPGDSAEWYIPVLDGAGLAGTRLVEVSFDSAGAVPCLIFTRGASLREKIIIPVPSRHIAEAEALFEYFQELLDAGELGRYELGTVSYEGARSGRLVGGGG